MLRLVERTTFLFTCASFVPSPVSRMKKQFHLKTAHSLLQVTPSKKQTCRLHYFDALFVAEVVADRPILIALQI